MNCWKLWLKTFLKRYSKLLNKLLFLILALLMSFYIKATEVYVCSYENGVYECKLISEDPKPEILETDKCGY